MNSGTDVDLDQIACTDHAFFTGNAVYHFFIDRYTHRSRIAMVIQEARLCIILFQCVADDRVDLCGRYADRHGGTRSLSGCGGRAASLTH